MFLTFQCQMLLSEALVFNLRQPPCSPICSRARHLAGELSKTHDVKSIVVASVNVLLTAGGTNNIAAVEYL